MHAPVEKVDVQSISVWGDISSSYHIPGQLVKLHVLKTCNEKLWLGPDNAVTIIHQHRHVAASVDPDQRCLVATAGLHFKYSHSKLCSICSQEVFLNTARNTSKFGVDSTISL